MSSVTIKRKSKHFILNEIKLKRAQKILGTRTERETIERALDAIITEDKRNRRAWAATVRFIKSGDKIEDVYGK